MKKNKNNKLKEILKHLKRPLMILSIVFNILFTLLIVIGCVNNKKSSRVQSVNALSTEKVLTLNGTKWKFNDVIYTGIRKVNGEYTTFSLDRGSGDNINYTLELDFRTDASNWNFNALTFLNWYWNPTTSTNTGGISYRYSGGGDYHEEKAYFRDTGWVNEEYQMFNFITIYGDNDALMDETIINWFYANATLLNESGYDFVFNKNFNYNAPYKSTPDSIFVNAFRDGALGVEKIYDFPMFVSNGQVFNRIRLWYGAGGSYFEHGEPGNLVKWNGDVNMAQYDFMQYINTRTGAKVQVNDRVFAQYYDTSSNTTSLAVTKYTTWKNAEYQKLHFVIDITPEQKDNVAQFNNYQGYNGFYENDENVGLSNVFTLLGGAFASLISLFKIELLPGISIGLLFFMPLIVGIILLIIWLVKR